MILIPKRNIYFPERNWPGKYQRGAISSFPHGTCAAASGGSPGYTVTLTSLQSFITIPIGGSADDAGIRAQNDGNVSELNAIGWFTQNSSTEYIPGTETAVGQYYECYLTGSGSTPNSGTSAFDTWLTLNNTRVWTWTGDGSPETNWSGTLTIREIADTSNSDSASVTITIQSL